MRPGARQTVGPRYRADIPQDNFKLYAPLVITALAEYLKLIKVLISKQVTVASQQLFQAGRD